MNTPRKNFDYNSPYTRPVQAYPSQADDYISLDMGGLKTHQLQNNAPQTKYNESTPSHYSGKYYQQNHRNSHHKNNRNNSFNNNYNNAGQNNRQQNIKQQQQRFTPRKNHPYNHEGGAGGQQQRQRQSFKSNNDSSSIAAYVHPSMTEDPWSELIKRAQSLRNSSITLKDKIPLERNSSTDSDNASDEVVDDSLIASSTD